MSLSASEKDTTDWFILRRKDNTVFLRWSHRQRSGSVCPCGADWFDLEERNAGYHTIRITNNFRAGIGNRWASGQRAQPEALDSLGGDVARLRFHNGNSFAIDSLRIPWPNRLFYERVEPGEGTPYVDSPGLDRWPFISYRVGLLRVETMEVDDTPDLAAWPPGWYTIPMDTVHWFSGTYPGAWWVEE
ncbi:MAG: hypothetical protein COV99_09375 [Bacteroidetes bacterium CG12_big_fil_rev_8_21_14_0_65_60_17]|nr:MAG: hypothetical protein COV99_09375 [Bacteroidetes bacterium CG12_big_fil_rev_8_21_14_0_65_60_17]